MITFELPDDRELLAAVGKVTLRHTQLDHVLKMVIKSFLGISVQEALDATEGHTSAQLRDSIKRLAKQRFPGEATRLRLSALLGRAKNASKRRNELVHRLWGYELDGTPKVRDEHHRWNPPPTTQELLDLADEINEVGRLLNEARLEGFVREALDAHPEKQPTQNATSVPITSSPTATISVSGA